MEQINRRQFLSNMAGVLYSGALGSGALNGYGSLSRAAETAKGFEPPVTIAEKRQDKGAQKKYRLAAWTGDDPTVGHRLRDGMIPELPGESERTVDFVIIGGGIAGLASAYFLRDHDFLLLEQYGDLGGQARGSSFNGIGYSYGGNALGSLSEESAQLLAELGVKPVQLDAAAIAWRWENQWVCFGEKDRLNAEFKRFREQCAPIWNELKSSKGLLPLPQSLSRLDKISLAPNLQSYNPEFIKLLDSVLKACTCGSSRTVSALAGYSTLAQLSETGAILPGGNQGLVKALTERLSGQKERVCRNTFVWSIDVKENGCSVVYSTADGTTHRVQCRFAIVTVLPMVAARLVHGIDDMVKAKMLSFRYGSYLVANLLLRRPVFSAGYTNWLPSSYPFSDIVIAETPYKRLHRYSAKMGSVLTIYQPYESGTAGRALLFAGDRDGFARAIMAQMESLVGLKQKEVEEIVLSRWGHAMAVPSPGFFQRMSQLTAQVEGAYCLAHCSTQGIASAQGALRAARLATKQALAKAAKTSFICPRNSVL